MASAPAKASPASTLRASTASIMSPDLMPLAASKLASMTTLPAVLARTSSANVDTPCPGMEVAGYSVAMVSVVTA
ncbi:hypothetical protein D3C72_1947350 [compost metagenome]